MAECVEQEITRGGSITEEVLFKVFRKVPGGEPLSAEQAMEAVKAIVCMRLPHLRPSLPAAVHTKKTSKKKGKRVAVHVKPLPGVFKTNRCYVTVTGLPRFEPKAGTKWYDKENIDARWRVVPNLLRAVQFLAPFPRGQSRAGKCIKDVALIGCQICLTRRFLVCQNWGPLCW